MLLTLLAAAGAGLAPVPARSTGTGPADGRALERALATVDADRMLADVEFLASDELEGRDSPSEGLRIAARFLRARLVRLGWRPGAEEGYFHTYSLDYPALDPEATRLTLTPAEPDSANPDSAVPEDLGQPRELTLGRDYFFYAGEEVARTVAGPLVFCGDGAKETFERVDVAGRFVLCLDGELHWRRRERYAREAGAVGMLTAPGPTYEDEAYAERFAPFLRRALHPRVSYPTGARNADGPPFAQLFVAPDAARGLFPWYAGLLAGTGEAPGLGTELPLEVREERGLAHPGGRVAMENVAGWWPGADPELAREAIVLSAHYDHVGRRGADVYNGADDNASGSAALLAVAEALAAAGPLRRSVLLLWVSAEEKGLFGSRAWTEAPWLPNGGRVVCNINLDMVGRNAPDELHVTPTASHPAYNGLTRLVERFAVDEGFREIKSADEYWMRSDHANFSENLGVPVAFLFADVHEDYHKPTDTADKIDADKLRRVVRLVLRMLSGLQADELGV